MDVDAPAIAWIDIRKAIKEYGAKAIFDRVLTVRETKIFEVIDIIEMAYKSRDRAADKYAWAKDNPQSHALLNWARQNAKEIGYDC